MKKNKFIRAFVLLLACILAMSGFSSTAYAAEMVTFSVNYWLQKEDGNPSICDSNNYTLESFDIFTEPEGMEIALPLRDFEGFVTPANNKVTAADGLTVDCYYTRKVENHTVTVNMGAGVSNVSGQGSYPAGTEVVLKATRKDGYKPLNWDGSFSGVGDSIQFTMPDEDVWIVVQSGPVDYTISYNLNGGIVSGNPEIYTVLSEAFTLKNPTKEGFVFSGWTGSNGTIPEETVTVGNGMTGDLSFTANWEAISTDKISYTVNHWQQDLDGDYHIKESETLSSEAGKTVSPGTKRYAGFTSPEVEHVSVKADGSTIVDYYYERNQYLVDIMSMNGHVNVSGKGNYLYEAPVTATATPDNGYQFDCWVGNITVENASTIHFNMPAQPVVLAAVVVPITYTISYFECDVINPIEYNIETETFTLTTPSREGYVFLGWTGSNGNTPELNVTIEKGSFGNKEYIANWKSENAVTYIVNHWKQNVDGNANSKDKENYSLAETEIFYSDLSVLTTIPRKVYEGFDSPEQLEAVSNQVETITVDYYYTRKSFNVVLEKGTGIKSVSGDGAYLYEQPVSIKATIEGGYEFTGWSGDLTASDMEYHFLMGASDLKLTANAKDVIIVNEYQITYELNGGTLSQDNPLSFKNTTEDFSISSPTKVGYKFLGWTGSNGDTPMVEVVVHTGTERDLVFSANWEPIAYTISYKANGGSGTMDDSMLTYNETSSLSKNTFKRDGYTFIGWSAAAEGSVIYKDMESVKNLSDIDSGKVTLFAIWEKNKETETNNQGNISNDVAANQNQQSNTSGNQGSANQEPEKSNEAELVKTGDYSNITVFAIISFMSVLSLLAIYRKKRLSE